MKSQVVGSRITPGVSRRFRGEEVNGETCHLQLYEANAFESEDDYSTACQTRPRDRLPSTARASAAEEMSVRDVEVIHHPPHRPPPRKANKQTIPQSQHRKEFLMITGDPQKLV